MLGDTLPRTRCAARRILRMIIAPHIVEVTLGIGSTIYIQLEIVNRVKKLLSARLVNRGLQLLSLLQISVHIGCWKARIS